MAKKDDKYRYIMKLGYLLLGSSLKYILSPNLRLAQLSNVLSKTRLQVSSLVVVNDVDLCQLV